ncbi:lipocalin family protein [Flavivirga spongiicola]|uniref:Lipocalin family protein n=1 Tax=Flavivirga spongiicola TaxID=421621 RepID=A0ABU7Y136_9FLAO|nr:lipocalin family protein [Flavivirga sp. MEBiC05379]MDO5980854.1 lipocalin family protein [Flavivirga sp. MEBiC05379]
MKKLSILFIALTLVLTTSCSSDDASPEISGSIIGTWKGISVDYSGTTVTSAQGQSVNTDYVGEAYDIDYSLTFNENPNNLISTGSYSIKLTSTVAGQTTTRTVENLKVLGDGTWKMENNELEIITGNGTGVMKIEKLTESELVLSATEVTDLSQGGVSVISTTDVITTYKKQ